jgi:hypothetical protein
VKDESNSAFGTATTIYRIDPLRDRLRSLRKLGAWHKERTGEDLHRSVPYRWAQVGIGGLRLPTVRIGGVRYTSEEAIAWWTAAISSVPNAPFRTQGAGGVL